MSTKTKTCGELKQTISNLQILILLFAFCYLLFVGSCRDKPTPPPDDYQPSIFLSAEDIGVTDVFIKIKFIDTTVNRAFSLTRDGQTILSALCSPLDTLVLDEGLLPKRTYKYKAYRFINSTIVDSSAELIVPTMDSSSHNFNFEVFYLGEGNSSILRDVCIINDTCVWAVGEIYKKDSTGQFETQPYNAAHWNGKKWELKKIKVRLDYGSSVIYTYTRLNSVFAATPEDIWFVHYVGGVTRYKNNEWVMMNFLLVDGPGGANKIWGTSSNNMYFVADLGRITHYNGVTWRRLESGTDQQIGDIFGVVDSKKGINFVLAAASNVYNPGKPKILKIDKNNLVDTLMWNTGLRVLSIWFKNENAIYACGDGVFNRKGNNNWKEIEGIPLYTVSHIRGISYNDIFVVGHVGLVAHFNGLSWKVYPEMASALYYSCDYKNDMMVAVGTRNARAVVLQVWR